VIVAARMASMRRAAKRCESVEAHDGTWRSVAQLPSQPVVMQPCVKNGSLAVTLAAIVSIGLLSRSLLSIMQASRFPWQVNRIRGIPGGWRLEADII
jgi:hypothetical protein